MSLPTKTLSQITDRATAHFRTSFRGLPLGIRFFLGRSARALALAIWGLHKAVEDVDRDIVPSPKMSTDRLSDWAFQLGLPDGKGGYGRLLPVAASGGAATLTGVKGTVYPDAITATAEDGSTVVALSGSVTIPGSGTGFGSIAAKFIAITEGSVGNLPRGTVLTWDNPPTGADGTFTLTGGLSHGDDLEDNPGVYGRIVARLQTPPDGGNAEDVRIWLTVDGVAAVYVYPRRGGTGTVDAVIAGGGSGQARVPSGSVQTAAQDSADANRPAGSERVTAVLPYMPDGSGHAVRVRVEPSALRYAFDWDDAGTALVVDTSGYAAGPPATITVVGALPASLTLAIDAYKSSVGLAPRLQVLSTGAPVNAPIRAVDYTGSVITLETVPDEWIPPADGDEIYAYGPVVATIAAGTLALCDSLGPSRVSGFGDAVTPWSDKLTISGIIRVAEDAIDTDGSKLISEVSPGDATIDGVADDVQGGDTGLLGPEMLYLSHVAVTA
jgi:hypothetical protein